MRILILVGLLALFHPVPEQADKPDSSHGNSQQAPKAAPVDQTPSARPSPPKKENSADSKANDPSWCERLLKPMLDNWPLIGVAIWGIIVAIRTVKAIKEQAGLMQLQLELSQRPWVSVVRIAQALRFDPDGAKLGCIFKLENCGGSVAWNVSIWTELVPTEKNWIPVLEKLCNIPKNPVNAKSDYGYVLFPKENTSQYQPTILTRKDLDISIQNDTFKGTGKVGFMLVGCIDYRSHVSPDHYQTTFVDLVGYPDQNRGGVMMGAFDPTVQLYGPITLTPHGHGASAT